MSLSDERIKELKLRFGSLHAITISGTRFIFRGLNRSEAAALGIKEDEDIPAHLEEDVCSLTVLDPDNYDFSSGDAGVATALCEAVLEKSGMTGPETIQDALDRARARRTVFSQIAEVCCAAFPSLLPGDLDDLPLQKLMELLAMAEQILILRGELMEPISFGEPEEVDKGDALARALEQAAREQGIVGGEVDVGKKPPWATS